MLNGNFLYLPGKEPTCGDLLILGEPSENFTKQSVVSIPYSEPRLRQPKPVFYPIISRQPHKVEVRPQPPIEIRPSMSREEYLQNIWRLKEHIQRGDIYEINYCNRFSAKAQTDSFSVFVKLCESSKAPYQMLARLQGDLILCASPELFLRKTDLTIHTKPIKGTIRRSKDPEEDQQLKERLFNSRKDRIENVMAVDVARNDLSMIAARGSVEVNQLYNIESFETVHQMVSTVSCTMREDISFNDIISATFPMASMTGAPKYRAMQLIGETENFDRGHYSGTLGIVDQNGDFELPVLIRSIFISNDEVWFATGGAITHLSDPSQEYEECLLKAATMLRALNGVLVQ